jgi:dipeptidyl aminopeptidase/acylaminoacyl peptidase
MAREYAMIYRKWIAPLIGIILCSQLLAACSFTFQIIPTPGPTQPVTEALPSTPMTVPHTPTAVQPTEISSSPTPTLIPINTDTIYQLGIYNNIDLPESLRTLAFSPDGSVLAGAGGDAQDFSVHLWHAFSGEEIGALVGPESIVWNVAFSPDGRILASASSDGTVKIWDWHEGQLLKTLDFPDQVGTVSFSPDGQTLAVGGLDDPQNLRAAIWIYSTISWNLLLKIPESVNITAMAYSPDGRWLIGGGASRDVRVWRTSDGTTIYILSHPHPSLDVAISPDNSVAATATCSFAIDDDCQEGGLWLWDLTNGRLIIQLEDFPDTVENVTFSPDGSFLIAASRDGLLRVYDAATYALAFVADPPGGNGVLALSPDGGLLATGGSSGEVRLWKVVERP